MTPAALALTRAAERRRECWLCGETDPELRRLTTGGGTLDTCAECFQRVDDESDFTDFPVSQEAAQ